MHHDFLRTFDFLKGFAEAASARAWCHVDPLARGASMLCYGSLARARSRQLQDSEAAVGEWAANTKRATHTYPNIPKDMQSTAGTMKAME